jgi:hypothetical protein
MEPLRQLRGVLSMDGDGDAEIQNDQNQNAQSCVAPNRLATSDKEARQWDSEEVIEEK